MYETLLRPLEVETTPAPQPIGEVADKLMKFEQRREEKRQMQIAGSRHSRIFSENVSGKRKREETLTTESDVDREESDPKKIRMTPLASELIDVGESSHDSHQGPINVATLTSSAPDPVSTKIIVSKGMPDVRGHTSYLTFACLLPDPGAVAQPDSQ
jgi:tRNA (adenine57-N1/adenine58-N1)-methyltransferase